jgi:uncharacterized protein (DUF2062 family)
MARKFLKRIMPNADFVRNHPSLQRFAHWLHDPNLWRLNRYSASMAMFIGLFSALIPLPSQMPIAALWAIWWRANLPISVALVWLTNPITTPPIYYASYKIGSKLLGRPPQKLHFDPSLDWFLDQIGHVWQPWLLGCLCLAISSGLIGALGVRLLWRVQVIWRWRARQKARASRH